MRADLFENYCEYVINTLAELFEEVMHEFRSRGYTVDGGAEILPSGVVFHAPVNENSFLDFEDFKYTLL